AGFGALGVFPGAHPALLAAFAFIAGAGPAAAPGGLRALLTSLVPERAVTQALSYETTLTFAIWAISPAAVTGLALSLDPRLPLLLGAVLMAAGAAGMWALPVGWVKEAAEPGGESMVRTVARAWPVFVTGAASLSLLGLAELILPALLEQRGIGVGWAGPLLAGFAIGSGAGAFLYGLRGSWPGTLPVQSLVLMSSVSGCVVLVAVLPSGVLIGVVLGIAGVLQAGSMMTRQLTLRAMLPSGALAAAYSVMYAAVGAGYAAAGTLSGALLKVTSPSTAILAGVGLTVVLTLVGAVGERSTRGTRKPDVPEAEGSQAAAPDRKVRR
ncbi:MFS transporter, partial [Streptomyces sp. T-3]|nr:MFS transporter [Streptomyces sp. T-3]